MHPKKVAASARRRLIRIWVPAIISTGNLTDISNSSHYLRNVVRCKAGDTIKIFNADCGEWLAVISSLDRKNCSITPQKMIRKPYVTASVRLCLAFAPFKALSPSFIIQKSTELGVSEILPIISEYTVLRSIQQQKLMEAAVEATEQCERLDVPYIHDTVQLDEWILDLIPDKVDRPCAYGQDEAEGKAKIEIMVQEQRAKQEDLKIGQDIIIVCEPRLDGLTPRALASKFKNGLHRKIILMVGPEGGFSEKELQLLQQIPNVYFLNLGPVIMRAETACLATIAVCKTMFDMW